MLRQVVAAGCLLGAATEQEARALPGRVPGLSPSVRVARWLRDLYPPGPGEPDWLGYLQPDRLAELHTVRELVASPELSQACLTSLDSRQARRAVTLLAWASSDDPDAEALLSQTLPDVADFIVDLDAPRETLTAIYNAIPYRTVILAPAAVILARQILGLLPADSEPADRAYWLSALGVRFSALGRPADALPVTEEAVAMYRELAAASPDRYRPHLADSLTNLGVRFSELGRPADGLPVTEKAHVRRPARRCGTQGDGLAGEGIPPGERVRKRRCCLRCPRCPGRQPRRSPGRTRILLPAPPGPAPGPRLRRPQTAAGEEPTQQGNLPESWTPPQAPDDAIDPRCVGSPALITEMLTACSYVGHRQGPRFAAFYGCMYYAMMRPAEVAALTRDDCHLPEHGWGRLTFTDSSTAAGKAVTDDGQVHEHRRLKGRTKGRPASGRRARRPARQVPVPPELVTLLRDHLKGYGTGPDGRLFRSEAGNPLQPSTWWRIWQKARAFGLTPAQQATPLLQRPYDLRHSGVTCGSTPACHHRSSSVGRAQRRSADARLRQVHARPGRRLDQPHERRLAPARSAAQR